VGNVSTEKGISVSGVRFCSMKFAGNIALIDKTKKS